MDTLDVTTNMISFLIMLGCSIIIFVRYRKCKIDRLFLLTLVLYPLSYLVLVIGGITFILHGSAKENSLTFDQLYNVSMPLYYLVMWFIEFILIFEMQLMRLNL